MDTLHIEELPRLRRPLFVSAFTGWNDAAEAATSAARFLVENLGGKRFAWIPPETYFQFSDLRPIIYSDEEKKRRVRWPTTDFFYCHDPLLSRDLVVGIGAEPHFYWQQFSGEVLEVVRRCGATDTISLGALIAGYFHTEPIHVVGLATSRDLSEKLGVELTRYEGRTGIVGVIYALLQDEGIPAVSLWANVPPHVASLSNPKAIHALLERLCAFGGLRLDLSPLEELFQRFDRQVEDLIAKNPEISSFVSQLQGNLQEEENSEEREREEEEPLSGEGIAAEIERYLRRRGSRGEGEGGK